MATGYSNADGPWADYAILEPSKPEYDKHGKPIQWRVQKNHVGTWRCFCKSFIFSGKGGSPKSCKHIRHCQHLAQDTTPVTTVTLTAVAPAKHPQWDSAYAICSAMVDQARLIVNEKQRTQMVEVLAQKLAAFTPAKPKLAPVQAVVAGVRHITFDD